MPRGIIFGGLNDGVIRLLQRHVLQLHCQQWLGVWALGPDHPHHTLVCHSFLTDCVTVGKLFNLSVPQFPHHQS